MDVPPVQAEYEGRLQELSAAIAQARGHFSFAVAIVMLACASAFVLGLFAIGRRVPAWWPLAPVGFAIAAGLRCRRHRAAISRIWRLERFYEKGQQRLKNEWAGDGFTGIEFEAAGHPYARDLNVLGEGSLFELLCIVRTAIGQRSLAAYLLETPPLAETLARQAAVRELRGRGDLREAIAALGESAFSEAKWETFTQWLKSPPAPFPMWVRAVAGVTSSIAAVILIGLLSGLLPWNEALLRISPFLALHSVIGLIYRKRVTRIMAAARSVDVEIALLREGLELMAQQRFQAEKLAALRGRVLGAAKTVRRLERLLSALGELRKEWFYVASLLLLAGTQLSMALEHWRARHGAALRDWLEAWGEFEALNALANYAYENPGNPFPEFTQETLYEARALGHPLLPDGSCIRNDVALNTAARFYVVSGSNMAGKTTLLRAIGLNAVLALAGAPVRAAALRLSHFAVCGSISVVDSQLTGRSKFLVEVERLRQAIEAAKTRAPALFLIDEILGGTNSRDRRAAAEAVIRTLIANGAVGAVSTHDMALTEIAELDGLGGANFHMTNRAGSGPLDFDYRLKPGITKETNALAIALMAGVTL